MNDPDASQERKEEVNERLDGTRFVTELERLGTQMRHDDGVEAWIASTATGEKNTEYKFLSPEPGRRECYIKGRPHDEFKVVVVVLRGFKFHTAAMVQQEIEIDGHWRFSTPRYVIKGQLNTAEHGIYITEYREDFQPLFPVEGSLVTKLRFGQLVCEESEESEEWIADSVLREHCLKEKPQNRIRDLVSFEPELEASASDETVYPEDIVNSMRGSVNDDGDDTQIADPPRRNRRKAAAEYAQSGHQVNKRVKVNHSNPKGAGPSNDPDGVLDRFNRWIDDDEYASPKPGPGIKAMPKR
ncbi:hypothetical protein IWX90DRAFT_506016 [Phyllosticta citrichinensis]|uniref:Uncharacterized protein n=1 Tax=Phyllosticta citrichinensis TaxID=1130410 RepID=A0ABR1XMM0_9PEZI